MNARTIARSLMLLALLAALGAAYTLRDRLGLADVERWVAQLGALGPVLFIGVYALATVLFLPGSVLTLAGGALFGPVLGTFCNLTGATIGATAAFLIARYLASDWVARRTGGRIRRLIRGVEQEGWRFVAFVRLVPLFPFNLLNYALGLTRIPVGRFALSSYLAMIPGALAYTYLGYAGRAAAVGDAGSIRKGLLALALLAVAMFVPRFVARLRRAPMEDVAQSRRRLGQSDVAPLDVRDGNES